MLDRRRSSTYALCCIDRRPKLGGPDDYEDLDANLQEASFQPDFKVPPPSIGMLGLPYRPLWMLSQLLLFLATVFLTSLFIDMSFAEPGKGYISKSGQKVRCEALAPRDKSGLHCSVFGSKETNPVGYALVIGSLAGVILLGWWCGRPGRGIPSYRTPRKKSPP